MLQDFYNLVDVYLDAVLHPKCIADKQTFEQEGWHLELEDPEHPLSYKGVVFNEMKGVYSSPDSMFYRQGRQLSSCTSNIAMAVKNPCCACTPGSSVTVCIIHDHLF